MKQYTVVMPESAEKYFRKIPLNFHAKIKEKVYALGENPRPDGYKKMKGEINTYRIRIGDYRVVYKIQDDKLIVLVVKLGQRNYIYK